MNPAFFKTDIDIQQYRDHARENYVVGDPIDAEGIRHPVWVHEAATMNLESWQSHKEFVDTYAPLEREEDPQ